MAKRSTVPNWRPLPYNKEIVKNAIKQYVHDMGGLTLDQISHMLWEWVFGMSEEERESIARYNLRETRESTVKVALNECIKQHEVYANKNKSLLSLSPTLPDRETFDLISVAIKLREKANGDLGYGYFHQKAFMTRMPHENYPLRLSMQDPAYEDDPNSICYFAAISRERPDIDLMRLEQFLLRRRMSEETTVYLATWNKATDEYIRDGRIHLPCYAVTLSILRNTDLNKVGDIEVSTTGEFAAEHYAPDVHVDTQFYDAINDLTQKYVSFQKTAIDNKKRPQKLESLSDAMTAMQAEYDNLVEREAQLQATRATGSN